MKVLALCMCFARRIVLLFLLSGTFATAGQAVTLDWDGVTWNPGSVRNAYDVNSGHLGNDIIVPDSGAGSGAAGSAMIGFGSTPITSLTFPLASGPDAKSNPDPQYIGLCDITFTPIPEINPAWSALGSCLVAAALILRHSAKFRK
ncbi:MAG: hypothetical protein QOF24_1679 [Verrucomicrobiota bacterium]